MEMKGISITHSCFNTNKTKISATGITISWYLNATATRVTSGLRGATFGPYATRAYATAMLLNGWMLNGSEVDRRFSGLQFYLQFAQLNYRGDALSG